MGDAADRIDIEWVGDSIVVEYAAQELKRCIEQSLPAECSVKNVRRNHGSHASITDSRIVIGTSEALSEDREDEAGTLPARNTEDDAVHVDVTLGSHSGGGLVTGSNPRSVLIAAYKLLHRLGYRWVRPGSDGEVVPQYAEMPAKRIIVRERASYKHRGICIEGAVGIDHVKDVIEWLPRVGMNAYFIQFREAYTFFDRWYRGLGNPGASSREFTADDARKLVAQAAEEIAKRGLIHHAVGHGWTCEPFGIPGLEWAEYKEPIPEDMKQYFAMVDGRRELHRGVPLNTNLCYSNPEVRKRMVDAISDYAREHPEVAYLHVWLADGSNNNCECEQCRQARPSDLYVKLLNEIDDRLTPEGCNTKIVFLIYVDLLWPPEHERLKSPDRFTLMFAPITRSYSVPFSQENTSGQMKPFNRNKLEFPKSVGQNLAYLRAWQSVFSGDSFDFDYHLMWDHYSDPGYMQIASVLHTDVRDLKSLGLNGYMSCQVQRAGFPTGYAMYLLAGALWDRTRRMDELETEYFEASFGSDGPACARYLKEISDLFDPPALRGERNDPGPERISRLEQARRTIADFLPTIHKNIDTEQTAHSTSWRYLAVHAELTDRLAQVLIAEAQGEIETATRLWDETKTVAWEKEPEIHRALDTYMYIRTLESRILSLNDT